jgi:hypothetical protein
MPVREKELHIEFHHVTEDVINHVYLVKPYIKTSEHVSDQRGGIPSFHPLRQKLLPWGHPNNLVPCVSASAYSFVSFIGQ